MSMKKIIITALALVMAVTSVSQTAFAASQFNSPGEMPTITVTNANTHPCNAGPIDGCWQTSTTARPGEVIAVHLYYKNTSNEPAHETTLSIKPSRNGSYVTFTGGAASVSGPRVVGTATATLSTSTTISYIGGCFTPYAGAGCRSINESGLFGTGFNIGTVNPGQQGILVARFVVDGSSNTPNYDSCEIDSFTASPSTIDRDEDSTLRWRTNGDVDYVTISSFSGHRSPDGSLTVSPNSTTTYTIRAYCQDGSTDTDTVRIRVEEDEDEEDSDPQAITTVATVLNGSQARLNGLAIPNTNSNNATAWFEWGTSQSLGNRTNSQSVGSGFTSRYYSDVVTGLVPGVTYYYRAVVRNSEDTAYGSVVRFETPRIVTPVTPTPPPRVIVRPQVQNVVVAQSAPSLLELRVETNYDRMCVEGNLDYSITYRNISNKTLNNAVLQFNHPKEITYLSSSKGDYEVIDRTITIDLGNLQPGEQGNITVHAKVNNTAVRGNLTVATATVVYTNSGSHAQEDAIAYSLITVSDECPNVLGASAFGFGSFLPTTLLGWLLLILVILALIVLSRHLYKKNEKATA